MAATALAAQLQVLSSSAKGSNESFAKHNTRPSILFGARQAADIDIATILSLALSGLEELAMANPLFANFKKSLFSVESSQTDRELQGQEFNTNLNISIHSFMCLVADFLLLNPAHQTLEYLIRRYKIHIYNVDDLIRFMLPYHETSLFVRVVQLSSIEKTRWCFLEGVRKSGAVPPRNLLVQQCLRDSTVLEEICESGHIFKIGSKTLRAKTAFSFSVAMVIEVLNAAQAVDSMLVNKILSYVTHTFDKGSSEESQVGGLMIIGTLVNKSKLSENMIAVLFDLITRVIASKVCSVEGGLVHEMAIMVLIQVVQTQSVKSFPEKASQVMLKLRELPNLLFKISVSFNAESALTLLINGLIRHCLSIPYYKQGLRELLDAVPLKGLAETITLHTLNLVLELLESKDVVDGSVKASEVVELIVAIKDRFPEEVDSATHKFLEPCTGAKDKVLSLLNSSFKGSLSVILPESNQSICRSLQHPQMHVRMRAVREVATLAKSDLKMKNVFSEASLLGLHDTNLSLVEPMLSVDCLATLIDSEELFLCLASIIERCVTLLAKGGPQSSEAEAISAGKCCLNFLSSVYLEVHPSYAERVGHVLLSNMLLSSKSWKLNLTALKLAKNMEWNFFKGLAALNDAILNCGEEKSKKKVWMHELNTKVVELLSASLSENLKSLSSQAISCATKFERAKPIVMLVLLQSLKNVREGMNWEAANEYLGFLKQEWVAIETTEEFSTYKFKSEEISGKDMLTRKFFKTLWRKPKFALASLLLACFYRVVECIPDSQSASRKDVSHAICNVLEELFEVFSSPCSKMLFEKHSKLLLKKLPIPAVIFFSSFFNAEGGTVPTSVQVNSLDLFLAHCSDATTFQKIDVQVAVPHLVVALTNPVKGIRRASFECLTRLFGRWRDSAASFVLPNGSQLQKKLLDSESFETFMESLLEYRDSFVSSAEFLCLFLTLLLGFFNGQPKSGAERDSTLSKLRFKKPTQMAIYQYLLHNAFTMSTYAQSILIMALKGAVSYKDQALETKKVLEVLLRRWKDWKLDKSNDKSLSKYEVQIFRHLLEIHLHYEGMFSAVGQRVKKGKANRGKVNIESVWYQTLMEVLNVDKEEMCLDLDATETLSIVLSCLEEKIFKQVDLESQFAIFKRLLELSLLEPLQPVFRGSLQKLQVHSSIVLMYINGVLEGECNLLHESIDTIKSLTAVLEFLLVTKDIQDMHDLIPSLFGALRKLTSMYSVGDDDNTKPVIVTKHVEGFKVSYVQQLILEVLERIVNSMQDKEKVICEVDFLVEFIHGTTDMATLNQSLSLLTTLGRVSPDLVLEHVVGVFSVMGETTLIQEDSHSYAVFEKLLAAVIPNWLEKMKDPRLLLQIFVKALPNIPDHRKIPFFKTTLSLMQESTSLHVLLVLLLESSLASDDAHRKSGKRNLAADSDKRRWVESFSTTICEEYDILVRLPALLNLLAIQQELSVGAWKLTDTVVVFVSNQLKKKGLFSELQSKENEPALKATLIKMMEEVLSLLQQAKEVSVEKKLHNEKTRFQENASHLLESITTLLPPASFAEAIVYLLRSGNTEMKIKALLLIEPKLKKISACEDDSVKRRKNVITDNKEEELPKDTLNAYENLIEIIGSLIDEANGDVVGPAISALQCCGEQLGKRIPSAFVMNLDRLLTYSQKTSLFANVSLQCMAIIVSETGINVLPMLPQLIRGVMSTFKSSQAAHTMNGTESRKEVDLQMMVLSILEAVVQNLGTFLSPYLGQILDLLLLEPCFVASAHKSLVEKAELVRHLLPKAVPVRLLLDPLISMYDRALEKGGAFLSACIEMLLLVVTSFDKQSVLAHYKAIFELCLRCLDLRRIRPHSLSCVTAVETSVISLFSALVLKLSESTFKPLFVRILEWAETELPADDNDDEGKESKKSVLRNIAFYRLVNQLGDKLRSVFVPYFQYLLKGCVPQLIEGQDKETVRPRKKIKVLSEQMKKKAKQPELTSSEWHLRYLIISALHKCFLYDTIGFLDTSKFQMLLGPLVQQLAVEKSGLNKSASDSPDWIPSTQDMDSALVACLGQMAITAGTDLLWKPLNHEVLLCTRSDAVHTRLLSLDIVKYLVDNLKEDYLALLPETIPFLAELLEDSETSVVSKSQETIKVLEELSGESLSQYL